MNYLKKIRISSGLKVNKIANELDISRRHYYNLEDGNTKLNSEKLDKLSVLFKVKKSVLEKIIEEDRLWMKKS